MRQETILLPVSCKQKLALWKEKEIMIIIGIYYLLKDDDLKGIPEWDETLADVLCDYVDQYYVRDQDRNEKCITNVKSSYCMV